MWGMPGRGALQQRRQQVPALLPELRPASARGAGEGEGGMIPYPLKSARPELFDLGKFQDNLPRPERSGLLSVGIGICVFISLITAVPYADIDWFRDCPIPVAATPHRTTWITFYPGEIKGKKPCTCHPDARYVGGKTQHFHETTEESCDSAPSAV